MGKGILLREQQVQRGREQSANRRGGLLGGGLTGAILGSWSNGSLGSCPMEEKAVCPMGGRLSVIWLSVLWEKGCS